MCNTELSWEQLTKNEFEDVQIEMARRKEIGRSYSGNALFSAKIVCAECGHYFGAKVWHSTSKYRRVIWQCNGKFKYETHCSTPHFYEDEIKERFIIAFNQFFQNKELVLEACEAAIAQLSNTERPLASEIVPKTPILRNFTSHLSHGRTISGFSITLIFVNEGKYFNNLSRWSDDGTNT